MRFLKIDVHRFISFISILLSLVWLSNLASTDAYFSVYVLIAFVSFYLQLKSSRTEGFKIGIFVLSLFFSASVLLANYSLFTTIGDPAFIGRSTSILMNLINGSLSFTGGICVFYPVIYFVFERFPIYNVATVSVKLEKYLPLFIFLSITAINLVHLFFVEYPGNLTEDSFTQISEMISGEYSNFNTFWHTVLFQGLLSLGYSLFSDINVSIAVVTITQSIFLAFVFTHCLITLRFYGVPNWALIVTYVIYAIVPYNLALSITIWKDVLFAGSILLLLSVLSRIIKELGPRSFWNFLLFIFSGILMILSRTNGWLIYLVFTVVYLLVCRKDKFILITMCSISVLGWFLMNPALDYLGIGGDDKVESLSIPIQQVSRVIAGGKELYPEEAELLSVVVDLEEVPFLYTEWLSDPMKIELRSKDYDYFLDHIDQYKDLWIRLGMRYPWEYVKAWVEQTKGYWNAGYDYALYSETITDNPYGVEKSGGGNIIASLFRLYFGLSRHLIFFEPLHSIGLHVWIVILCFLLNVFRRREQYLLSVPLLELVIGLWFGTPVYCCFRYVYPVFVSFPLILFTTLYEPQKK